MKEQRSSNTGILLVPGGFISDKSYLWIGPELGLFPVIAIGYI
jgi:hypothetical protein